MQNDHVQDTGLQAKNGASASRNTVILDHCIDPVCQTGGGSTGQFIADKSDTK